MPHGKRPRDGQLAAFRFSRARRCASQRRSNHLKGGGGEKASLRRSDPTSSSSSPSLPSAASAGHKAHVQSRCLSARSPAEPAKLVGTTSDFRGAKHETASGFQESRPSPSTSLKHLTYTLNLNLKPLSTFGAPNLNPHQPHANHPNDTLRLGCS